MSLPTGKNLARPCFGHSQNVFQLHEVVEFSFFFGRKGLLFLARDEIRHALLRCWGRLEMSDASGVVPVAIKSMISR
jgi:hypothetical protein